MRTPLLVLLVAFTIVVVTWVVWRQSIKANLQVATNTNPIEFAKSQQPSRLSYEDTCKALQQIGHRQKGAFPPRPDHRPRYDDDEPLGLTFFRTSVRDGDMENMTLSRTYFAKSDVGPVSFRNTDLSESTLCWNDFNKVDFTDADLSRSDLRASLFCEVAFVRTNLAEADLRRSTFEKCDFADAKMTGAKLTRKQADIFAFSKKQVEEISWQKSEGDEPDGG